MRKSYRKIAGIVLLILGSMPFVLTICFKARQEVIRHGMRQQLEKKLLRQITIDDDKVQWIEKDEEIRIDGKLFDIKKMEHHEGSYTFIGLFDQQETELMLRIEDAQDQSNPGNNKLLTDFFQWLQTVYHDTYTSGFLNSSHSNHEFLRARSRLSDQFLAILVPPPKKGGS